MPAAFLHGVETFEFNTGPASVLAVKSAVIGLVGSAPFFAAPNAIPLWQANSLVAVGAQAYDANGNLQKVTAITLAAWQATHAQTYGNLIVDSNGNTQMCIVAGTTGASAPAWGTTVGAQTASDGSVTWLCVALGKAAITAGTAPTWGTTLGSTVTDNTTITWTLTQLAAMPLNQPIQVSSYRQAAGIFGPLIQGYSIPYALNAAFSQTAPNVPGSANNTGGPAVVVNVLNPFSHNTVVAEGAMSLPASGAQLLNLGHMGVFNVLVQNTGKTVTYYAGIDYTLDAVNGIITRISTGNIAAGQALQVGFTWTDPSKVNDAALVGTVGAGVYTGMQCFLTCYGTMGFFPKLLIAPAAPYAGGVAVGQTAGSQDQTVAAALTTLAGTIRAIAFVDEAPLTPIATAIADRGNTAKAFDTSSDRIVLCFPWQQFTDLGIVPTGVTLSAGGAPIQNVANVTSEGPLSSYAAGATSVKDYIRGFWWSPSNTQLVGPLGPDVTMYFSSLFDPNSDPNNLNASGICTVYGSYGTSVRFWGNRSAAYPSTSYPNNFINVRRTLDQIEEATQLAMLQFMDAPITNALIVAILESVNSYLRSLVQRGALIQGVASYNPGENPPSQIGNGQLVFDFDVTVPTPAERITFNVTDDVSGYGLITGTNAAAAAA